MDPCKDREEESSPPKTTLYREHESQAEPERSVEQQITPDSAGPEPERSCMSMKKVGAVLQSVPTSQKSSQKEIGSHLPRMESNQNRRVQQQGTNSPESSCLSLKSNYSKDLNIFFQGHTSVDQIVDQERFPVPSGQTSLDTVFMLLEENLVSFVKKELKHIKKLLHQEFPESEDEEVLDEEDGDQRRSNREALLKIALNFLRTMNHGKLAECLQNTTGRTCDIILEFKLAKLQFQRRQEQANIQQQPGNTAE